MYEASFTGLIRTLAIIIIIYYGIKIIFRYVMPLFIKRTFSKMEDRYKSQQEAQQEPGKVGETVIDKKPNTQQNQAINDGEYIDYEEVE
jgi:hypothetical protein